MGERQLPELYPGWKTVRKLGSGSFGTVYEIERDLFGKIEKAALKCIAIPQNDGDVEEMYSNGYDDASITAHFETYLANIVREYSMMVEMKGHTNVVYCDDIRYVPREDGIGWDITIKMELLTPLIKTLGPDFGEEQVIRLGKDLCRALALCKDRDIVHRDIKPQNIFVSKTGDYKLGDFGIAKTVEQTTGGTKIGTYSYMAPEVYHNKPYGSGADIYSLGLVMYWLLNERRLPFLPLPPKSPTYDETEMARHRRFMGEEIPAPQKGSEELKRIVLKACAIDPQERYASAQEMLDALERIGQAEPVVNKVDLSAKTATVDTALDETCGPMFATVSAATATMTEGPVFAVKPADATMTEGAFSSSRLMQEENRTEGPIFEPKRKSVGYTGPETKSPVPVVLVQAATQPDRKKSLGSIFAGIAVIIAIVAAIAWASGLFGGGNFAGETISTQNSTEAETMATEETQSEPPVETQADNGPVWTTEIDWLSCSGADVPECGVSNLTKAIISCPAWEVFDSESVQISITNPYGRTAPFSMSDFDISWGEGTVTIEPKSVDGGVYTVMLTSGENYAQFALSYGHAGDVYLAAYTMDWYETKWQNLTNQQYFLMRDGKQLITTTDGDAASIFTPDEPISGTRFTINENTFLRDENGMTFQPRRYRVHGGRYFFVFERKEMYLAVNPAGDLYATSTMNEECYWWLYRG